MIKKILIANRGEIAVRIIKTCKRLNITAVVIYSEVDKNSLFVELADEAYPLHGSTVQETYLNIENIIKIAKLANIDAIHPGYGFLSENSSFAQRVIDANLIFIGPNPDAISAMGLKSTAKELMIKAGVSVLPGYNGENQTDDVLLQAASNIGYPILIKAAAGGGGKGMRIVHESSELLAHVAACKREALKNFANDQVILEKYLQQPRHIEVQILFDQHNNGFYLFERDCSLQRRYQKVIEEAPAPGISEALRAKLGQQALQAGQAVNYRGAGTVEFLVDNDQVYFMEMNTRLQVEHPVTEMITGLDLVELQIDIANNKKLAFKQADLKITGHAIEARLYSEDVDHGFLPATGRVEYLEFAKDVRIDTGIQSQDEITIYYDPMIAKIIAWGENREQAIQNLITSLQNTFIAGVKTNTRFLLSCLHHQDFKAKKLSTNFIDQNLNELLNTSSNNDYYVISTAVYLNFCSHRKNDFYTQDPWQNLFNYRVSLPHKIAYNIDSHLVELEYAQDKPTEHSNRLDIDSIKILLNQKKYDCSHINFEKSINACNIDLTINEKKLSIKVVNAANKLYIFDKTNGERYLYHDQKDHGNDQLDAGALTAPMPGTIIAVKVTNGSKVKAGDALVILEAMKMEHTIFSPINGVVKDVLFKQGEQVNLGAELLVME